MDIEVKLIVIMGLVVTLGKVSQMIVKALEHFCQITGLGQFTAAAILIAITTSLPEIVMAISSALSGIPQLAYGNAIGASMIDISWVMGVTAIWGGGIIFHIKEDKRVLFLPIAITALPILLAIDGNISRTEGIILLSTYTGYLGWLVAKERGGKNKEAVKIHHRHLWQMVAKMTMGVGVLVVITQIIVSLAKSIAVDLNFPIILVGLFIVSFGTTLPELMFSLRAAKEHHPTMVIGNIISSCVTNSNLAIGLAAIINPIKFKSPWEAVVPGTEYLLIMVLFAIFVMTKKRLDRWEGIILILLFIFYAGMEIWWQ